MQRTTTRNSIRTISVVMGFLVAACICALVVPATGHCRTNIAKPSRDPQPAKVKLGEFTDVQIKAVGIDQAFASDGANQKALKKIDELLFNKIKMIFPNAKRVGKDDEFSKAEGRSLQITPVIKQIKFISGGARFWAGAMAGNSAVLMQLTIKDATNNEIIADEQFYRSANAFAGAGSMGGADNAMLDAIADDIAKYCLYNK